MHLIPRILFAVAALLLLTSSQAARAQSADQEVVSVADSPDPVAPGATLTYTITYRNNGPDAATNGGINFSLPQEVAYQNTVAPAGFTCSVSGQVGSCTNPSLAPGEVVFTMTVQVASHLAEFPDGSFTASFSTSGTTPDPNNGNNSKSATTNYDSPQSDLSLTVTDSPDPVFPDGDITYTVTVANAGPDTATNVNFSVFNNNTLRFRSATIPSGFTCSLPPVDATPTFSCTNPSFAQGMSTFTIVVRADSATLGINDTTVSTGFSVSGTGYYDPNNGNNSETESTAYVTPDADMQVTVTDSPDPVGPDGNITYTVTVTNAGPDTATNATLTVPMNGTLKFISITAPAGWNCTGAPPPGGSSTFSCSNPSFASGGNAVFTVVLHADEDAFGRTSQTIMQSFLVSSAVADPVNSNNSETESTAYVVPTTFAEGSILISEIRTSGPGGAEDDFVELYNNSDSPAVLPSGGLGLFQAGAQCVDAPVLIATVIPNATIPARGHYLITGSQYSLSGYAAKDQDFDAGKSLAADRNVGLFTTTDASQLATATRLDAVGLGPSTGGNCDLLKEGTPLGATGGSSSEHSFYRKLASGRPADTGDNAADFQLVSTDAAVINNVQSALGAPGPERSDSPIQRNDKIKSGLIDPQVSSQSPPNSVRRQCGQDPDQQPETCDPAFAKEGTFSIRRRWTNGTGAAVTRLRFRIVNMTTLNSAGYTPGGGQADLRAISSGDVQNVQVTGGDTVTVRGTTLEAAPPDGATAGAPAQPGGGGLNATLAVGLAHLNGALPQGESIDLQFLLGVVQPGFYRFFVNVEAGPPPAGPLAPERGPAQPGKQGIDKRGMRQRQ